MEKQLLDLTERILTCAFYVHARLGPGLLESTYRSCLQHRLTQEGFQVDSEVPISIVFDGVTISGGYRISTSRACATAFVASTTVTAVPNHSPDSPDSLFQAVDYFPWKSGFCFARKAW